MRNLFIISMALILLTACEKEFGVIPDGSGLYQKVYGNLTNNTIFDEGAANKGVALVANYATDEIYAIGSVGDPSDTIAQKVYVFKTDKNGFLLAEAYLGKKLLNEGIDIVLVEDGVIICGLSKTGLNDTGGEVLVAKLDQSLNLVWETILNINNSSCVPSAINVTEIGNVVILGNYINAGSGNLRTFISTLDAEGNMIHENPYDSYNIAGKTLFQVNSNLIWCGTELRSTISKMNFNKADVDGDLESFEVLKDDNSRNEVAKEIHKITEYDYALIGSINFQPDNEDNKTSDIQLSILNDYDANTALQWSKSYGGDGFDEGVSMALAKAGGYIILGNTESFGSGGTDFYLIKTDAHGEVIWEKTFGGDDDDEAADVISFNDGYAFIGTAIIADRRLITIIRTDLEGNII